MAVIMSSSFVLLTPFIALLSLIVSALNCAIFSVDYLLAGLSAGLSFFYIDMASPASIGFIFTMKIVMYNNV